MRIKTTLFLALIIVFGAQYSAAQAADTAVAFVQEKVSKVLDILSDPASSEAQKEQRFHDEIIHITDVAVIARFVLGPYAAKASAAEMSEFRNAFETYATNVYQTELSNFGSEVIKVHRAKQRKPGDSVVLTTLSGGVKHRKPRDIKWRVLKIKGYYRVVDIEISGVWLSQHQRAEVTGIITRNGGDIRAASKFLCAKSGQCQISG
jgi:phospholipid transport system substrate-binding protein